MRKGDKEHHVGCFGGFPVHTQYLYQYWYWVGEYPVDLRVMCDAIGRDRIPFPSISQDAHPRFALALLETGVVRHMDRVVEAFQWIDEEIGIAAALDLYEQELDCEATREKEFEACFVGPHMPIPF